MKITLLKQRKRIMERQMGVYKTLSLESINGGDDNNSNSNSNNNDEEKEHHDEYYQSSNMTSTSRTSPSKETINQFTLPSLNDSNSNSNNNNSNHRDVGKQPHLSTHTSATATTGTMSGTTDTNDFNNSYGTSGNGYGNSYSFSSNGNNNSNGNSKGNAYNINNNRQANLIPADYVVSTMDIASQQQQQLQQQQQQQQNGQQPQPPRQRQRLPSFHTGDVDVIGILNASSPHSITPSQVFRKSPNVTPVRTRPPPSPSPTFNMNVTPNRRRPQQQQQQSPSSSLPSFPTFEVKIAPKRKSSIASSSIASSQGDKNRPSTPPPLTTTTNTATNTKTDGLCGTSVSSYNSAPVSPLTPKGGGEEEEETTQQPNGKAHRRMSSSERLLKMLEGMDRKPMSFDDGKDGRNDDDDDDDDTDTNNTDNSIEYKNYGSTGLTTPTINRPLINGMNGVRSGVRLTSADSISAFTPTSNMSSSYKLGSNSRQVSQRGGIHRSSSNRQQQQQQQQQQKVGRGDPTLHAQSFILALAFFAIWSPQNLMAPNLTQMAEYFHFSPEQRDAYLGANIALATGVLSLPLSALLGFLADVVASRIQLFAGTVCLGGISAICTGLSETYAQLYFSRFLCGGCMAGSVVIAFSILGDFFDAKDRNAASSGLSAMMGTGILFGQVFAGTYGDTYGWKSPFYISGISSIVTSAMVLYFVREPVRGGKEKVLQEMIANGTKYDRKLTVQGFLHAMTKNKTNVILMLQGLFTNVPWGIIFTFLNDYLSQEQGLSVPASTFLVLMFGIGSAIGGICGGFCGSWCMRMNRSILPLFMAVSTLVGIAPFLGLLDLDLNGPGFLGIFLGLAGGCIANLPSVNVRPIILNVNPPETRGAAMTANNLMVNVARGAGPSLITLAQKFFGISRQYSFNVTLIVFWVITFFLLIILSSTLPYDQDEMEKELQEYAQSKKESARTSQLHYSLNEKYKELDNTIFDDSRFEMLDDNGTQAGEESVFSIEDRMTSFNATAVQESWTFIEEALREIAQLGNSTMSSSIRGNYDSIGDEVWDGDMKDIDPFDNDEENRES
jgi:predicted MFS family arabinose efflux permease